MPFFSRPVIGPQIIWSGQGLSLVNPLSLPNLFSPPPTNPWKICLIWPKLLTWSLEWSLVPAEITFADACCMGSEHWTLCSCRCSANHIMHIWECYEPRLTQRSLSRGLKIFKQLPPLSNSSLPDPPQSRKCNRFFFIVVATVQQKNKLNSDNVIIPGQHGMILSWSKTS